MGAVIQYVKAQLKYKFSHPVKALILFFIPLVMFFGAVVVGKNWKRETTVVDGKPSFYGILISVVTFLLYMLYTFTAAYDVIRERVILRKQFQLANGFGSVKYHWGWIFTYGILILPTALVVCIVVHVLKLFPTVGFLPIFVDFYLFQISAITVAFWVSCYVPVPVIGAIVVTIFNLSFVGAYFPMSRIPPNVKETLCLFVSPVTIGTIIDNFQHASVKNQHITAFNLIPTQGGEYSVFALTLKLFFNNLLYVSFGSIFEKLFNHLNRNKNELKKREFYENEVKNNSVKIDTTKKEGAIISVDHAFKTYFPKKQAPVDAVKNVSFEVYKNEIFAIVGKEGAGKSTIMKLIGGRFLPSYGDVRVMNSFDKDQIGAIRTVGSVAPQDDYTIFEEASVADNIEFYKSIVNNKINAYDILNELNFKGKKSDKYSKLDVIEKSKVKVAIAFLCNREIALLDEPTTGMTEKDVEAFWNVVEAHRRGKTIVVTTTSTSEAEQYADRVLILENGRVNCIGEVEFVKENTKDENELQVKVEF
ncbi:P-loop containing nucleoside triphosphate hydrolase protein [Neocallimastix lanati (nom. inval.)]|jgi:ABC-type multidrug transport system ATPase subunit|nr:P-loop containing nucleoside triphosphate hydrolase protein [Neocallimastix sp. JGI-2020a]